MPIAHSQNSFTAGRLSPLLHARPDLQKYHNGCEVLTNWLVYPQGGAYTVPGTRYIAATKATSTRSEPHCKARARSCSAPATW